MANLGTMLAWLQILTQQQLTDSQLTSILNLCDAEEVESRAWARLQTEYTINSFALYSTGTVAVNQGSNTVTGTGTAWTTAMVGMLLSVGQPSGANNVAVPMVINAVNTSAQTLTLSGSYPSGSGTGLGYAIFPQFYSVPAMGRVSSVRQQIPLGRLTHGQINLMDPYLQQRSSPSESWAPFGQDEDGNALIQLWPVETAANAYTVYGFRRHVDMENPNDRPAIPSTVIMNFAAMRACESLYSLNGDPRWTSQRDYYAARYDVARTRAIDADTEEFGTVSQVQDSEGNPDFGGWNPGIDIYATRDIPGEG